MKSLRCGIRGLRRPRKRLRVVSVSTLRAARVARGASTTSTLPCSLCSVRCCPVFSTRPSPIRSRWEGMEVRRRARDGSNEDSEQSQCRGWLCGNSSVNTHPALRLHSFFWQRLRLETKHEFSCSAVDTKPDGGRSWLTASAAGQSWCSLTAQLLSKSQSLDGRRRWFFASAFNSIHFPAKSQTHHARGRAADCPGRHHRWQCGCVLCPWGCAEPRCVLVKRVGRRRPGGRVGKSDRAKFPRSGNGKRDGNDDRGNY